MSRYKYKYPRGFDEYVIVLYETVKNKTHVANRAKEFFSLDIPDEPLRSRVRRIIDKACLDGHSKEIKRLFFDIETSPCFGWFWRAGYNQNIGTHQIIEPSKIICVSYKWQGEDKVHTLKWNAKQDDSGLLKKFVKVLGEADEIIGHNIDKFDLKILRTRCIDHRILMFPTYRTLDTLKKARKFFAFNSNKLDYIGEFLLGKNKIPTDYKLWMDICLNKCPEAMAEMIEYCENDVILTEDAFSVMMPYIDHNTNFAVMKQKDKWHCPECCSDDVSLSHTDTTPMGYVKRHMKCHECKKFFRVSNKTYLRFLGSEAPDPDSLK